MSEDHIRGLGRCLNRREEHILKSLVSGFFSNRNAVRYPSAIKALVRAGLITVTGDYIEITPVGRTVNANNSAASRGESHE